MPNSYVPRQIEPLFRKWLKKPEVLFLTGARQVGKTTLLKKVADDLRQDGQHVDFFNLEEGPLRQRAQRDPHHFIRELTTQYAVAGGTHFLFIDEFQKVPEILEAIKVVYDEDQTRTKFVLSGSASVITRKRGEESLLGRSVRLNLFSFSWLEFNLSQGRRIPTNESLKDLLLSSEDKYVKAFDYSVYPLSEYLLWGGFPRVASEAEETSKLTLYENIKEAFLERDIQSLIREEQLPVFEQLMEMLAARCGNLISFSGLARDLAVSPQTVRHLSFLLRHSYWLDFVYPLAQFGSEYKKAPKVYFHDLGFRHSLLRWLSLPNEPAQMGAVAENLIFNVLTRLLSYDPRFAGKLRFWQTYDGAEVDFVLDLGRRRIGIEAKYRSLKRPLISKGAQHFIEKYKPDLFLIVNKSLTARRELGGAPVLFLPLADFAALM